MPVRKSYSRVPRGGNGTFLNTHNGKRRNLCDNRDVISYKNEIYGEEQFVQTAYVCPELNIIVAIDLPTDADTIAQLWSQPIRIGCPVCGSSHRMNYRDAYVTGLMAEFECLPADVQRGRVH